MFGLNIEMTRSCNLNCRYCYVNKSDNKEPTSSKIDGLIKTIKNNTNITDITLLGGEVFLKPKDLYVILDNVYEINKYRILNVHILTNGTLYYEQLKQYKEIISTLQISIDGHRKIHNHNRSFIDGRSSYDKVIENVHKFYKDGFNVTLNGVVNNVRVWKRNIFELLREKPEEVILVVNTPTHCGRGLKGATKFILDTLHLIFLEKKIRKFDKSFHFNSKVKSDQYLNTCKGGTTLLSVSLVNDKIYPCQIMFEGKDKYYEVGKLNPEGIEIDPIKLSKANELSRPENFEFNMIGKLVKKSFTKKFPHNVCFAENKELTSSYYKLPLRYMITYLIIIIFRRLRFV